MPTLWLRSQFHSGPAATHGQGQQWMVATRGKEVQPPVLPPAAREQGATRRAGRRRAGLSARVVSSGSWPLACCQPAMGSATKLARAPYHGILGTSPKGFGPGGGLVRGPIVNGSPYVTSIKAAPRKTDIPTGNSNATYARVPTAVAERALLDGGGGLILSHTRRSSPFAGGNTIIAWSADTR